MDNSDNENPVNNNFPSGNEAQIKTDSVSAEEETANAQRKKRLSEIRFSECGSGGQRFAWLMNYIRTRDFRGFGWYRIILGMVVIAYFYLMK